jgi:hypothetical protein
MHGKADTILYLSHSVRIPKQNIYLFYTFPRTRQPQHANDLFNLMTSQHFYTDAVNGALGHELKYRGSPVLSSVSFRVSDRGVRFYRVQGKWGKYRGSPLPLSDILVSDILFVRHISVRYIICQIY